MPTADRSVFVEQSIRYFLRQDYPARELIIVDDGEQALDVRLVAGPNIVYHRLDRRLSVGVKRNIACRLAQGSVIVQWDDDDWYAPDRLSVQVRPILAREAEITGLTTGLVLDAPRDQFWRMSPEFHRLLFAEDVHGGTLAYARHVWDKLSRYPDASQAEDAAFLLGGLYGGARLKRIENSGQSIYVRHGTNLWEFECGDYIENRHLKRSHYQAPRMKPPSG